MNTQPMSALQKLIHEGRTEGFRAGQREAIPDVLSVRFGEVPSATKTIIESRSQDSQLPQLRELAKTCSSLASFTEAINAIPAVGTS